MTVSTDSSTPVDYLLRELARALDENRRLRRRVRFLRASRDRWRGTKPEHRVLIAPDDPRWHGTRNGYTNLGCRCDFCREAERVYRRGYRERMRAR
jgi:hypothetical protein